MMNEETVDYVGPNHVTKVPYAPTYMPPVYPSTLTTPISYDEYVKTDNKGKRDSSGKPRFDLIPPEFLDALAVHYQKGAEKYDPRNWERGMNWGECYRALLSHANKFWGGETFDVDPKMPDYEAHHMIAAAWNAIALYVYWKRNIGIDNRNVAEKKL